MKISLPLYLHCLICDKREHIEKGYLHGNFFCCNQECMYLLLVEYNYVRKRKRSFEESDNYCRIT